MANGDVLFVRNIKQVKLLDAITTSTSTGVWIDCENWNNASIDVSISATGTVQIRGSDQDVADPGAANDRRPIGADITASGQYVVTQNARWMKAKITANTGTISVFATLRDLSDPQ